MKRSRTLANSLLVLGIITWIIPASALADRVGTPYRGPVEVLSGGSADTGDDGGDQGGDGGGEGGGEGGSEAPPGGGGTGAPGGRGGTAVLDGQILWQWWWEHNKDRFLAAATEKGRVNAGSAYYWFGAGAKFPPRQTSPVSNSQRATQVYPVIAAALKDKSAAVRSEAAIAMGRLGHVAATEKQIDKDKPNNMVVRALIKSCADPVAEVRHSARLGLGISGDADGAAYLLRNLGTGDEKAYAMVALGMARHLPAVPVLVGNLPTGRKATNDEVAAIHALGLMGPSAVAEMDKEGLNGTRALLKIIERSRSKDDAVVTQAVIAAGRLHIGRDKLTRLAAAKSSKNVAWNVLLALANYSFDEKEAAACFKTLQGKPGYKNGAGQNKVFSILAMGGLARGLDSNSKTRAKILNFLNKEALEKKDNYVRSATCIALGMSDDQTARDAIAKLLTDRTGSDYTAGAAAIGLGLLRSTDHANDIARALLQTRTWKDDARGYGAIGLAMLGDTTRMADLTKFEAASLSARAERHLPIALGVLGDKNHIRALTKHLNSSWKKKDNFKVSNSAFGLTLIRDTGSVEPLIALAKSSDEQVRGIAIVALGYAAARDRIDPLSRSYENCSHRNKYGGWEILEYIAKIL